MPHTCNNDYESRYECDACNREFLLEQQGELEAENAWLRSAEYDYESQLDLELHISLADWR